MHRLRAKPTVSPVFDAWWPVRSVSYIPSCDTTKIIAAQLRTRFKPWRTVYHPLPGYAGAHVRSAALPRLTACSKCHISALCQEIIQATTLYPKPVRYL